jgi:hypothetical protein
LGVVLILPAVATNELIYNNVKIVAADYIAVVVFAKPELDKSRADIVGVAGGGDG